MIVNKPIVAVADKDNPYTTRLQFANGVIKPFYMRGAVAFPEGQKEGFAMMAGVDLRDHQVIVFEQHRYWSVGHWLSPDGTVRPREDGTGYWMGLMQFVADCLSLYKCVSYFYGGQHYDHCQRYLRDIYRHPEASRKLEMIEVPYVAETGPGLLYEKIKIAAAKAQAGSSLEKSLKDFVSNPNEYDNIARCMMTLMAGIEYQPHIDLVHRKSAL